MDDNIKKVKEVINNTSNASLWLPQLPLFATFWHCYIVSLFFLACSLFFLACSLFFFLRVLRKYM